VHLATQFLTTNLTAGDAHAAHALVAAFPTTRDLSAFEEGIDALTEGCAEIVAARG
jgi:hypothetical protein